MIPLDRGENTRRWRWFAIEPRNLESLIGRCRDNWFRLEFIADEYVPRDMIALDVNYDWTRKSWMVRCEHPSFEEVPNGAETPYGGLIRLIVKLWPDTEEMAQSIEDQAATIHDLRE